MASIIGQHTRHDQKRHRLDGKRTQAVDLFGDHHGAKLGGVVGPDTAREHEANEDRSHLAKHGASTPAEQAIGAEAAHEDARLDDRAMPPVKKAVSATMGTDTTTHLVEVAQELAAVAAARREDENTYSASSTIPELTARIEDPGTDAADKVKQQAQHGAHHTQVGRPALRQTARGAGGGVSGPGKQARGLQPRRCVGTAGGHAGDRAGWP